MNNECHFENPTQVINMGGPWIGDLYIGDLFISQKIILDNIIYSPDRSVIYFIRYYQLGNTVKDIFLKLCYWDFKEHKLFESSQSFDKLYLKGFVEKNIMTICRAFHSELPETCYDLNLSVESFLPA